MLKIGDFSRLSHVPVKTIRYYDEIGLLKPSRVDAFSGYRYYTVDQLHRLTRILTLRDLGFSLEQIGVMLDDSLTAEQIRGMLRLKRAEIEQQIEEEQDRLARVGLRLRQIEQEGSMSKYEVIIKQVNAMRAAALRRVIPSYSATGQLMGELIQHIQASGAFPAGPPVALYHDTEFVEKGPDVEVAFPVTRDIPETGGVVMRELSAVETMASVIMPGPYENFPEAYGAIMEWAAANQVEIAGPSREVYLRGPESTQNPAEYVTEIQFPVRKV
jgi:DNA-binding transcriptional MerR regulator